MNISILNILITGGRAPVALDLARNLHASGHKIYVAESLKVNLCRHSKAVSKSFLVSKPNGDEKRFISEIIQIIRDYKISLLIPTCEEIFFISKYKTEIEQATDAKVFTDNLGKLKMLHNKFEFIERVKEYELLFPLTYLVDSNQSFDNVLNNKFQHNERLVLKPVYSRFGSKVNVFKNNNKINFTIDMNASNPWVIQRYIEGEQICTYSICSEGEMLAYSAYKSNFRTGIGAGISFEAVIDKDIFVWVTDIVKKLCFSGQISFDLIRTSQKQIYPIECNPRTTSGVHLIAEKYALQNAFLSIKSELVSVRKNEKAMLILPMIFYGVPNLRKLSDIKKWIREVKNSREAIFSFNDLNPFFLSNQFTAESSLYCL